MITEVNAVTEPTERSICPAVMSIVPGAATTPITATAVKMLSQLSQLRKYCERSAK